jgi:hypothetical protein
MCSYLNWGLTANHPILSNFEAMVKHDFRDAAPTLDNSTYSLQMVSKCAATLPRRP